MEYSLSYRLGRPQAAFDLDAAAYITAVENEQADFFSEKQKRGYDKFVRGLKQNNLWDSIDVACILGNAGSLSAAMIPIKSIGPSPSAVNFDSGQYDPRGGLKGEKELVSPNGYIDSDFSYFDRVKDFHGFIYTTPVEVTSGTQAFFGNGPGGNVNKNVALLIPAIYPNGITARTGTGLNSLGPVDDFGQQGNGYYGIKGITITEGFSEDEHHGRIYSGFDTNDDGNIVVTIAAEDNVASDESPILQSSINVLATKDSSENPITFSGATIAFFSFGQYLTQSQLQTYNDLIEELCLTLDIGF
jgi:hypothetical protein